MLNLKKLSIIALSCGLLNLSCYSYVWEWRPDKTYEKREALEPRIEESIKLEATHDSQGDMLKLIAEKYSYKIFNERINKIYVQRKWDNKRAVKAAKYIFGISYPLSGILLLTGGYAKLNNSDAWIVVGLTTSLISLIGSQVAIPFVDKLHPTKETEEEIISTKIKQKEIIEEKPTLASNLEIKLTSQYQIFQGQQGKPQEEYHGTTNEEGLLLVPMANPRALDFAYTQNDAYKTKPAQKLKILGYGHKLNKIPVLEDKISLTITPLLGKYEPQTIELPIYYLDKEAMKMVILGE